MSTVTHSCCHCDPWDLHLHSYNRGEDFQLARQIYPSKNTYYECDATIIWEYRNVFNVQMHRGVGRHLLCQCSFQIHGTVWLHSPKTKIDIECRMCKISLHSTKMLTLNWGRD